MSSGFSTFHYKRHSPTWRFWRERFALLLSYDLPIPVHLAGAVRARVDTQFMCIWQDDEGQWYLRGRIAWCWDGASVVPTPTCVVRATFAHDLPYQYVVEIAAAWGCSRREVRRWADGLFRHVMREDGSRWERLYYGGVVLLGGLWNEAGLLLRWRSASGNREA